MESTKIVWHDPNIFGEENYRYIREHLSPLQYKTFTTVTEAVQFLSSTTEKWILVTSGTSGEELVKQVHNFPSVIGIIIFCNNYAYHKQWSSAFKKVKRVEISNFGNVLQEARKIWDQLVTYNALFMTQKGKIEYDQIINALEINTVGTPSSQIACDSFSHRAYYHMESELEMSFLQICKLSLKNQAIPRSDVLNELKSFAITDENKARVEEMFGLYPNDLLRSFVHIYTSDLVFRRLNECYAANDYSRVMNITAACLLELKSRPELMLQNQTVLYRGVNISEKDLEKLTVGQRGFWPAFTSASTRGDVARRSYFQATVVFEIHLLASEPHPHIFAQPMSDYVSEQEVLLLPYFPLVITNIRKADNVTVITVDQDPTHPSLAFNSQTLINYWRSRIETEVMMPIDEICDNIRNKAIIIIDLPAYFKKNLALDHSVMPFTKDFEKIIRITYKKHENEIHKLNDSVSGSLIEYLVIMKNDIENSIVSYIKKNIEIVFDQYFEKIKDNIIKMMGYEVITTFSVPSAMVRELITKIMRLAEMGHFSTIPEVRQNFYEESKGETESSIYLKIFIKETIKAVEGGIGRNKEEIKKKNEEIKNELYRQLGILKSKLHQSLENVLL
ncbi:unnamed protein product [Blepharisma stoltei]|uniref:NAD(P)(+)--arginine ADP-ribosyltransferase n=1 Tax=Blepharisma stoltei TaxID=1481888 RepID=A0AAU9IEV7_9CILI|nr:unnamed protein product [Blepharisma stoltei]